MKWKIMYQNSTSRSKPSFLFNTHVFINSAIVKLLKLILSGKTHHLFPTPLRDFRRRKHSDSKQR